MTDSRTDSRTDTMNDSMNDNPKPKIIKQGPLNSQPEMKQYINNLKSNQKLPSNNIKILKLSDYVN